MSRHLSQRDTFFCLSGTRTTTEAPRVADERLRLLAGDGPDEGPACSERREDRQSLLVTLGLNLYSQGVDR